MHVVNGIKNLIKADPVVAGLVAAGAGFIGYQVYINRIESSPADKERYKLLKKILDDRGPLKQTFKKLQEFQASSPPPTYGKVRLILDPLGRTSIKYPADFDDVLARIKATYRGATHHLEEHRKSHGPLSQLRLDPDAFRTLIANIKKGIQPASPNVLRTLRHQDTVASIITPLHANDAELFKAIASEITGAVPGARRSALEQRQFSYVRRALNNARAAISQTLKHTSESAITSLKEAVLKKQAKVAAQKGRISLLLKQKQGRDQYQRQADHLKKLLHPDQLQGERARILKQQAAAIKRCQKNAKAHAQRVETYVENYKGTESLENKRKQKLKVIQEDCELGIRAAREQAAADLRRLDRNAPGIKQKIERDESKFRALSAKSDAQFDAEILQARLSLTTLMQESEQLQLQLHLYAKGEGNAFPHAEFTASFEGILYEIIGSTRDEWETVICTRLGIDREPWATPLRQITDGITHLLQTAPPVAVDIPEAIERFNLELSVPYATARREYTRPAFDHFFREYENKMRGCLTPHVEILSQMCEMQNGKSLAVRIEEARINCYRQQKTPIVKIVERFFPNDSGAWEFQTAMNAVYRPLLKAFNAVKLERYFAVFDGLRVPENLQSARAPNDKIETAKQNLRNRLPKRALIDAQVAVIQPARRTRTTRALYDACNSIGANFTKANLDRLESLCQRLTAEQQVAINALKALLPSAEELETLTEPFRLNLKGYDLKFAAAVTATPSFERLMRTPSLADLQLFFNNYRLWFHENPHFASLAPANLEAAMIKAKQDFEGRQPTEAFERYPDADSIYTLTRDIGDFITGWEKERDQLKVKN